MADTSQLKKNDPINFGDDDPFAELTKIMGFDPREAVKKRDAAAKPEPVAANGRARASEPLQVYTPWSPRTSAAPAQRPSGASARSAPASQPAEDDFLIDLEKELLGEPPVRAELAPTAYRESPAPYESAPAHRANDIDLDAAFAESLAEDLTGDDGEPQDDAAPGYEPAPAAYGKAPGRHAQTPAYETGHAAYTDEDFAARDQALAEVDMDFGTDFENEMLADVKEQAARTAPAKPLKDPELEDELAALLRSIPRAKVDLPAAPAARTEPSPSSPRWLPSRANIAPAGARGATASWAAPAEEHDAAPEPQAYARPSRGSDDDLDVLLNVMTAEVHAPDSLHTHAPLPDYDHTPIEIPVQQVAPRHRPEERRAFDAALDTGEYPEVETVDVPETAVAYDDDLEIPDVAYDEQDPARSAAYDDFDDGYGQPQAQPTYEEPASRWSTPAEQPASRVDFDADFDALYRQVREAAGDARAYADQAAAEEHAAAQPFSRAAPIQIDEDADEQLELPSFASEAEEPAPPPRRGMLIAAVVGGVALLGGIGAFTMTLGNDGGTDAPVVVMADGEPVKVRPENPGGTSVPNQDNEVFETMAGSPSAGGSGVAPTQEKLISGTEEPVDIASAPEARVVEEDTAGLELAPKGEDRIDPAAEGSAASSNDEIIAVAPRKVKTMIVKPDGTLVPREEPAPVAIAPSTGSALAPATDVEALDAVEPEVAEPTAGAVPTPTLRTPGADTEVEVETAATATEEVTETLLEPAPLAAVAEPVVAEPAIEEETEVAAVAPAAAAAGSWSMQIASQPSAESAQATYEDLARRYGSVIGGRGVNIVKAEISGKGTYWRVRIPAETRNDAIKLCESYKAAGGNCFVSK
jgi:hypothetical protein